MRKVKRVFRRFLSLILTIMMILSLLSHISFTAYAATATGDVIGLNDSNIKLTFEGDEEASWSADGTTVRGSVIRTSGACSSSDHNSTLTITNNKNTIANLSFDYKIEQNEGTIQIDGQSVTANGNYSKELSSESQIKIYIKSGSTTPTKITISNLVLISDITSTTTFQKSENGSYTVDGKEITEDYTNTQSAMTAYKVTATPASGYQFLGWYNVTEEKYISTDRESSLNIEKNCVITARFSREGTAIFETGGQVFEDLNDAVKWAQNTQNKKITLVSNGILSGNYSIPSGITLLIPFDEAKTCYTTTPDPITTDSKAQAYRSLSLSEGTTLSIEGAVSVGGRYYAAPSPNKGGMSGDYGYIKMESSSSIIVRNGGALYAWGFISGNGSILAESGAVVYEWYQIADFRGGSATLNMGNKVFPFSQYYVQNIEVPLTLNAGAKEITYTGVYASNKVNPTAITFIGDDGMFKVISGSLTKAYDGSSDRIIYTVNGKAELNSLKLKLAGMNVSSKDYVLPITNNMTINLESGCLTLNQDTALLAGVQTYIADGAELIVSNGINIYVYDRDQWEGFCGAYSNRFLAAKYVPGRKYDRSDADITDARIDVNGTLIAAGSVYTTTDGADICSSQGTGKYLQQGVLGTEEKTYQYTQNGSKVTLKEISVTSARLHNADGSYYETTAAMAGDVITYSDGKWSGEPSGEVTITYNANGGEGNMEDQKVTPSVDVVLNANSYTREGYTFVGWNTEADGSGTAYEENTLVNIEENITLYAQWKANSYTVTWLNDDGTELEKDENVTYGTMPEYNGEIPVKEETIQYSYRFTGWTPEITPVTADITYKAIYEPTIKQYTVTWKNWDGTILETDQVDYGEIPQYTEADPIKPDDNGNDNSGGFEFSEGESVLEEEHITSESEFSSENVGTKETGYKYYYIFSGWTPDVTAVTGNAEYTAVFTQNIHSYTVIWQNWDKTELEKDENVDYDTIPEYNGEIPTRQGDAQFSYTFKGWSPSVNKVTGDIIYTAVFEETVNQYKITWQNWDGQVLRSEMISYGETPVYAGEVPVKEENPQYTYLFSGWTPEIQAVTEDAIYIAEFKQVIRTYTITWLNDDGTVLQKDEKIAYGEKPVYNGKAPVKEEDSQYSYLFAGWTPEIDEETIVSGDIIYTAVYEKKIKTYTVRWLNADGTELQRDENVEYGTIPTYKGSVPCKEDDQNIYTFSGWMPEIQAVTGNAVYTAAFTCIPIVKHTITFDGNGGTGTMNPQIFIQGKDTVLNDNTFTRIDYTFVGWNTAADGSGLAYTPNGAIINLDTDIILYAQWKHNDGWFTDDQGKQYYSDGKIQKCGWITINEKMYYLDPSTGYVKENGIFWLTYPEGYGPDEWDMRNNTDYVSLGYDTHSYFIFDSEGLFQNELSGMFQINNLTIQKRDNVQKSVSNLEFKAAWVVKGEIPFHPGLVNYENAWYYFPTGYFDNYVNLDLNDQDSSINYICAQDYYISKTNNLKWPEQWGEGTFTTGKYTFDNEGKLLLYDGFTDIYDDTYYYVKGAKIYAGLIQIGDDYYYINSSCKVIKDQKYTVSKTNDLLPAGTYTFDSDGKLLKDDSRLNGIVKENDTIWYYYVNGVKTYAGLIQINGDYYYVNSKFEVIHDRNYFISKTNGLLDQKTYTFDAKGKLIIPDLQMNGIVKENDDIWYYYVDGVKTYAGLIQIDGYYYYIKSDFQVVHGRNYYVSKNNNLLPQGTYEFDTEGKMKMEIQENGELKNGIVKENEDTWYYYVNGVKTYAGLIQIDGSYYYVNSQAKVIHGQKYFISKTNGYLPNASYTFGADGKMQ